jgi:hypothetical protein
MGNGVPVFYLNEPFLAAQAVANMLNGPVTKNHEFFRVERFFNDRCNSCLMDGADIKRERKPYHTACWNLILEERKKKRDAKKLEAN